MILENVFAEYDAAETVALLSSFVFQDKTESEPCLTARLARGCDRLALIADRIEAVSLRNKVAEQDQNCSGKGRPNFGMVELVWQWAQGMVGSSPLTPSPHYSLCAVSLPFLKPLTHPFLLI